MPDDSDTFQTEANIFRPKSFSTPCNTRYNPDLASTYEHIAKHGPEDFYSGTLAREIVETVRSAVNPKTGRGGMMEFEDIAVRSLVIHHSTIATTCRPCQIYLICF